MLGAPCLRLARRARPGEGGKPTLRGSLNTARAIKAAQLRPLFALPEVRLACATQHPSCHAAVYPPTAFRLFKLLNWLSGSGAPDVTAIRFRAFYICGACIAELDLGAERKLYTNQPSECLRYIKRAVHRILLVHTYLQRIRSRGAMSPVLVCRAVCLATKCSTKPARGQSLTL